MRTKRAWSMLLSFALLLSSLAGFPGVKTNAAEAAKKMVVYVAAEGKTASGAAVEIDKTAVQVTQGNTAETAVKQVLDKYYKDNYDYSNGFLSSIGEVVGSSSAPWVYWGFKVNGEEPQNPDTGWGYGIKDYPLQENDQISLVYGTFENMPKQCLVYDNDTGKAPGQSQQESILKDAREQKRILGEKIYEVNFKKGAYVPGIEDTDGLYSVFSLVQAGIQADSFYDDVCKKVLSQLQGMKELGKIYDSFSGNETNFTSYEGNKYVLINYTKIALLLSALGVDITKAGGVNLVEKMTDSSLYQKANATTLTREAMILLAMNTSGAAWKEGSGYLAEKDLLNQLLADVDNQIAISTDLSSQWGASLDSAAMVVQALAPYTEKKVDGVEASQVKDACEKVMKLLSTMQSNQTGGFSGASDNPWTLAQAMVTVGLLENGTHPVQDGDFIKNGKTLFDASGKYIDVEKQSVDENLVGGEYAYQPDQLLRGLASCLARVEDKSLYDTKIPNYRANTDYILLTSEHIKKLNNQTVTGKKISPSVTVSVAGKNLTAGKDYSVSYFNNIQVGTAYAVVTGLGEYRGTVKTEFQIVKSSVSDPGETKLVLKKPVVKKLSSGKKTLTVSFGKIKNAKKYTVQIATDKKFKKNKKSKTVKSATKAVFKGLKPGKKYYVRVRAYHGKAKSAYSKMKSIKVKK